MSKTPVGWPLAMILAALLLACGPVAGADVAHNQLTAEEQSAGWQLLFDGTSLESWRGYASPEVPPGWRVEDGTLHFSDGQGDIITTHQFANFELSLEWKVSAGGNSGIFYLAETGQDVIYMSAPEMQVLDDAGHRDGLNPLTSAGANYGLHPAPRGVVHAAGEWNHARIRVYNRHVEHWLNGTHMVEYVIRSPEWFALVAASKFADWPAYGMAGTGHIGLQDHDDPIWYRNIKIRVLE